MRDEQEMFEEYSRLLRRAWLNPSYAPWRNDVCAFERENYEYLEGYWHDWQEREDDE